LTLKRILDEKDHGRCMVERASKLFRIYCSGHNFEINCLFLFYMANGLNKKKFNYLAGKKLQIGS
jgi:hypothetical protein